MQNAPNQHKKLSRSEFVGMLFKGLLGTYVLALLPTYLWGQKPISKAKTRRSQQPPIQLSANPLAVKRDKKG